MTGVTRMSRARSRFRPSAAYMARVHTLRCYVHGDQHETEAGTFYCKGCDLFLPADHFAPDSCKSESVRQAGGHRGLYLASRHSFAAAMRGGDFIPGAYRPDDAANVVTMGPFAGERNNTAL
jgi:hypothetical protein